MLRAAMVASTCELWGRLLRTRELKYYCCCSSWAEPTC